MRTFNEEFMRIAKTEEVKGLKRKLFMAVETQCHVHKRNLTSEQKQEQVEGAAIMELSRFVYIRKIDEIVRWINAYEVKHGKLDIGMSDDELYNLEEL